MISGEVMSYFIQLSLSYWCITTFWTGITFYSSE